MIAGVAFLKVSAVYLTPAEFGLTGLIIGLASILLGVVISPLTQAVFVGYAAHSQNGNIREFRTVSGAIIRKRLAIVVTLIAIMGTPVAKFLGLHWATSLMIAGLFAIDALRYFEEILLAAARRQREVAVMAIGDAWLRVLPARSCFSLSCARCYHWSPFLAPCASQTTCSDQWERRSCG
jgi:hypothetical protein